MARLPLLLAAVLVVSGGHRFVSTQSSTQIPSRVVSRANAGELVDVIVGVESTFAPEGRLASTAAVDAQRSNVAREVDDVRARAAVLGVVVGARFDVIPFFRARVDARTLPALAAMRGVVSIQENRPHYLAATATAPFVNAPPAWAAGSTGAGWKVAVLDTGVDNTHPYLQAKVVSEACYSGTGLDSTSVCPGGAVSSTATGSAMPCALGTACHHGTTVAGVAAGINGPNGLSGVAPGAGIVAIQVASSGNSSTVCGSRPVPCLIPWDADVISGLARVATLAGAGNAGQIAAVNLSFASGLRYSSPAACDAAGPAMKAAIDNLRSLGVAVVAGSGNDGIVGELPSPACLSGVVSVGASTTTVPLQVPDFSNDAPFLSLLAPGAYVRSATPGGTYDVNSGTSLATPHVVGAWAVLKQAAPTATSAQVLAALSSTGTPLTHWLSGLSHPIINVDAARRALLAPGAVPGAVTALQVDVSGTTVNMKWTPPQNGGAPTGYALIGRLAYGGPVVATLPLGNVTSFTIGAPSGTFVVSIVASNAAGNGAESNPVEMTVPGLPLLPHRPTNLGVTVSQNTAAFTWTAPSGPAPVSNYVLAAGPTSVTLPAPAQVPLPAGSTSFVIPGVPPGTWFVRLFSQNAAGYSFGSNEVSFTVAGPSLPGPPVLNPATVVNRTVTLSWVPGPGSPTSYVLAAALTPGGAVIATVPLTTTSVSIPAVPSGTYFLRVSGVNALGTGPASNEVAVVVP